MRHLKSLGESVQLNAQMACPVCRKVIDGATPANTTHAIPGPGDVTVCLYCRTFLTFTAEPALRELTQEEILALPDDVRDTLVELRRTLRELVERKG